ncbi:ABC transporter permease [Streptomyces malaysiensis]|uniref:ABC transporter permease n=1 Tax=Streptomyces malaysiensis subsp. samsunensis TaxID=459658 RepID=A0A9X2M9M9_STRMQ|nr:ABC transporter permease [Streptomyces samsunensis]MCQ8835594.1 ABC transporter permease [Streptomyces samsunensis]
MSLKATLLFIVRRLAAMAVLMVVLSFAVFSLVYLAPGDAVDALLGGKSSTPELVASLKEEYHLNEPFFTQYWIWARDALHFDFGASTQTTLPVTDEIGARFGSSVFLGVYAYVLTLLFGVVPGVIAALRRRRAVDRGLVAGAVVTLSTPPFVLGILLLYLFAVVVPVFPAAGKGEGFLDQLWHLTLPAVALALTISAFLLRHTRASMIGVLDQDYVAFARARGLASRRIMLRYLLRNALIPVVTVSGVLLTYFVTGAVLVESTFSLGGLGELLVQSAESGDLPMIQGLTLIIAVIIISANLLADLAYMAIDPRIRFERRS